MPNYNDLIFTAADYTFWLQISGGGNYKLKTLDSVDLNVSVEEELIYAVSEVNAIGNKKNAKKVTGKFSMQAGEILSMLALEGLGDATDITDAILAMVPIRGGFTRTLTNLNVNTESTQIKRRDKESLTSMDFTALAMLAA